MQKMLFVNETFLQLFFFTFDPLNICFPIFSVNKTLYEECVIDEQCNGTSNKKALVCREVRHRKLCMCNSDYIEDNTYLECLNGTVFC